MPSAVPRPGFLGFRARRGYPGPLRAWCTVLRGGTRAAGLFPDHDDGVPVVPPEVGPAQDAKVRGPPESQADGVICRGIFTHDCRVAW